MILTSHKHTQHSLKSDETPEPGGTPPVYTASLTNSERLFAGIIAFMLNLGGVSFSSAVGNYKISRRRSGIYICREICNRKTPLSRNIRRWMIHQDGIVRDIWSFAGGKANKKKINKRLQMKNLNPDVR